MAASPSASHDQPQGEPAGFRRAHLATLFLQATGPLATAEIIAQVYNNPTNLELGKKELSADSARKSLKRDIDALKNTGLIIEPAGKAADGQALWKVNRDLSFTQGVALSEEDAAFLDIACLPLLDDPGFPERDELRLALAKIDRSFDTMATDALTASAVRDSDVLVAVRGAFNARTAIEVSYTARDGSTTVRRLAPLGLFDLRSTLYVVCASVDDGGELVPASERTYRLDRIESARPLPRISFDVPADFDVNAFRRLPFQIGSASFSCTFLIPDEVLGSVEAVASGKGMYTETEQGTLWKVEAANAADAAAWAIAYGLRPLAPAEVVDAWRARLEEALHG